MTIEMRRDRKKRRRMRRKLNQKTGFTPDLLDGIWDKVVNMASDLERRIATLATKHALQDRPAKSAFTKALRGLVAWGVGSLTKQAKQLELEALRVGEDSARGVVDGVPDAVLRKLQGQSPKSPRNPGLGVTTRVPKSLQQAFKDMAPTLYGTGSRLFDEVVSELAQSPPESEAARRRVAQRVLDRYRDKGVTGFIDKAGRRWNLTSYVEMATRTATTNIARDAYVKKLSEAGLDLARVTVMPNCHPFCQPYQGRLLSITGAHMRDWKGEKAVATLGEAIEHGYNHINCRHTLVAHIPGYETPQPEYIDPGDYKASQELRAMERKVRKLKFAERSAVTPDAAAKARAGIRQVQADIRSHVAKTGVPRNRWREQIDRPL